MVRMPKSHRIYTRQDSKQSSTYLRFSNEYNNKKWGKNKEKIETNERKCWEKYIGISEIIVPVPVASCRAFSAVPTAETCPMLLPIEIYTSTSPPRGNMGLGCSQKELYTPTDYYLTDGKKTFQPNQTQMGGEAKFRDDDVARHEDIFLTTLHKDEPSRNKWVSSTSCPAFFWIVFS